MKFLIVALVSGPASARAVEGIGRAGHRAERDVTPADRELARRVARMEDEFLGREANARFDEGRIETHAPRGRIDVGAGVSEDRARLVVQEVDADFLQDRKRGLMDRIRARPGRRGRAARKAIAADRPARRPRKPPPRSAARRRRRPVSCGGVSVVIAFPRFSSARARSGRRRPRFVADKRSSRAARTRLAPKWHRSMPIRGPRPRASLYFAARSFGVSAAAGSGSAGRPVAPAEKRAISQERNKATASLLRSSGWVVR